MSRLLQCVIVSTRFGCIYLNSVVLGLYDATFNDLTPDPICLRNEQRPHTLRSRRAATQYDNTYER